MLVFLFLFLFLFFLLISSSVFMGGGQSKRIGMLLLVSLVYLIERNFKKKKLIRFSLFLIAILPTIVFPNARAMLLS